MCGAKVLPKDDPTPRKAPRQPQPGDKEILAYSDELRAEGYNPEQVLKIFRVGREWAKSGVRV